MSPRQTGPLDGARFDDAQLSAHLAEGAGHILTAIRHEGLVGGRLLGDLGDAMAQAWISAVLSVHRPHDAVLSEEATDDPARLRAERVWIIDPLDGTKEFSAGRDDWAVHIALTIDGRPADSAVCLPATGELFGTDTVTEPTTPLTGRLASPRFWDSMPAEAAAMRLGLTPLRIGSAGAKAMAVVRGDADAYIHAGGQHEWDNCAPVGVALAAGLHCSRLDGTELVYNQPVPYSTDFLIARREIADDILEAIAPIW